MEVKRKHNRMLQNMSVIGKHYTLRRTMMCYSVPVILWGYYTRGLWDIQMGMGKM
jgi:hypothetical protein